MSSEAKAVIFDRIQRALSRTDDLDPQQIAAEWQSIPRHYDRASRTNTETKLGQLEDRLRDYDAEVTRVAEADIPGAIAGILAQRGHRPTVVAEGFPAHWLPVEPLAASILTPDTAELTPQLLDGFDGVLTGAGLAIAETGSLVLQNAPGQGRRATTLVPDFHLCVVRAQDVVENVPEAFGRLEDTRTLPTTFVSGPSATADIEMTRIKGVHGPRFLHVLLVSS